MGRFATEVEAVEATGVDGFGGWMRVVRDEVSIRVVPGSLWNWRVICAAVAWVGFLLLMVAQLASKPYTDWIQITLLAMVQTIFAKAIVDAMRQQYKSQRLGPVLEADVKQTLVALPRLGVRVDRSTVVHLEHVIVRWKRPKVDSDSKQAPSLVLAIRNEQHEVIDFTIASHVCASKSLARRIAKVLDVPLVFVDRMGVDENRKRKSK